MPPLEMLWFLFSHGGWVIFLIIFLKFAWDFYVFYIQERYRENTKYVLLAIDVPKENMQGPKAVEQIFASLAAAQSSGNLIDKYIEGYTQRPFSLEIVSLGGYIQFLIRTPEKFRDLAEAAFYAQYPDAEISEVDDYAKETPNLFPDKEYDLWGTELVFYNKDAYPIRTYPSFEDKMAKDLKFKDPIASLLEVLGKMTEGEQLWLQIIITPCKSDWKDKGVNEVKKLIGQKVKVKTNLMDDILNSPIKLLQELGSIIIPQESSEKPKKEEPHSLMTYLSPGEKDVAGAMQEKLSKTGFKSKFRVIYLAKKEFSQKGKAISGIFGALQQFNTLNMNGFKPDGKTKTSVDYWFVKTRVAARQKRIMANYKNRSNMEPFFILNTEELATLFHFPTVELKAPLLKRVEMKRGEAPSILPTTEKSLKEKKEDDKKGGPPGNLPIIE